jgi:hypothetical protein
MSWCRRKDGEMAFPSVGNAVGSSIFASAATHTVTLPTGIVSGSLVIIWYRNASGSATTTWPSGWDGGTSASAFLLHDNTADPSDDLTTLVWRKCDGSEGASITVTPAVATRFAAIAWRFTGHDDPTTRAPEIGTIATGTSLAPDATTTTPTGGAKDYYWLTLAGMEGENIATPTFPANYTLDNVDIDTDVAGLVTGNCCVAGGGRQLNAASQDAGAWTYTGTSDDWCAITVAVHPVAAGAPAPPIRVTVPHIGSNPQNIGPI